MKTITRMVIVAVAFAGFTAHANLLPYESPGAGEGVKVQESSYKGVDKNNSFCGVTWNNFRDWKINRNDDNNFLTSRNDCETKQVPEPSMISMLFLGMTLLGGASFIRRKSK